MAVVKLPDKDSPGAPGLDLAVNPGAPGLALRTEQVFSNPLGRLHSLDLAFALHGGCTSGMWLGPYELPRSILGRELMAVGRRVVVLKNATL